MVQGYDSWLLQQADEYMSRDCEGEPQVISAEKEFEGYDEKGCVEYSMSYTYNCEECDERDCEHWKDFHEDEWKELHEGGDDGTN